MKGMSPILRRHVWGLALCREKCSLCRCRDISFRVTIHEQPSCHTKTGGGGQSIGGRLKRRSESTTNCVNVFESESDSFDSPCEIGAGHGELCCAVVAQALKLRRW